MSIHELVLTKKTVVCDDVTLLDFDSHNTAPIAYVPGQYVNIFLADENSVGGSHGKSYSVIPCDSGIRIAVRRIGTFSSALSDLALGTSVIVDGPHGTLCPKAHSTALVCIAGGIGIAPFISWYDAIKSRIVSGEPLHAHFLISNTSQRRSPFIEQITPFVGPSGRIDVSLFFTREAVSEGHHRRITSQDIESALRKISDADCAICGSVGFTRDMWKTLKTLGVPEERIATEAFY